MSLLTLVATLSIFSVETGKAGTPLVLHFQGHIASDGSPVHGTAEFKFAILDASGVVAWSNSAILPGTDAPEAGVVVDVDQGFYAVRLGDEALSNMAPLSLGVFQVEDPKLRVWFNDGQQGFEQLSPDQPISASAFAVSSHHAEQADLASAVSEGSIELRHLNATLAAQIAELQALVAELQSDRDVIQEGLASMAAASIHPADPVLIAKGFQRFSVIEEASWENGSQIGAPAARHQHSVVWTGSEVLVWGGNLLGGRTENSGGIYRPVDDAWSALSPVNAPSPRRGHTAVWTGDEMIVWGGYSFSETSSNGGRFNPATHTWQDLNENGPPSTRVSHGAVWTGNTMVVWGGLDPNGPLNDGAFYDPLTDSWITLPVLDAPEARFDFSMVWAGDKLIIWGGRDSAGRPLNSGAQLPFVDGLPGAWQSLPQLDAPSARALHSAVWTGTHMLIWGGQGAGLLSDGAAFDPEANVWVPLTEVDAPNPRSGHATLWTGSEMLVLGGVTATGETDTGYAYDPSEDTWRVLTLKGEPVARTRGASVWTGSEAIVFGGLRNGIPIAALQQLNPRPSTYLYRMP